MRNPILLILAVYLLGSVMTRSFLGNLNRWARKNDKETIPDEELWAFALSWPITWGFCLFEKLKGGTHE